MGSSPGFGSAPRHATPCSDSLPLRLRACTPLTNATRSNSPAHSSIGTPSLARRLAPTARGRAVSGLGTPLPGYFPPFPHGTVRYRSPRVARLGGWAPRLPAGFPVPRGTRAHGQPGGAPSAYGALTRCGRPSQGVRLRRWPDRAAAAARAMARNPTAATAAALARRWFGQQPRSLTTTGGLAVASSSSGY
jgi:hypothetical protein